MSIGDTELMAVAIPRSVPTSDIDGREGVSPRPTPRDIEGELVTDGRVEQTLAPIDGGSAAWRLLCAAFVFEALLWGNFNPPKHNYYQIQYMTLRH